jgi:hypothetical protein
MSNAILTKILAAAEQSVANEGPLATGETKILAGIASLIAATPELATLANQQTILDDLKQILEWAGPPRTPTSLKFAIPRLISKAGVEVMPGSISVTSDHDARVSFIWADDVGPVVPLPGGTVISSDNTAVISGGDVAANDASCVLRTAGNGTCNVSVDNPGPPVLHDTMSVTVGAPVPTALTFDPTSATAVPKGTPA